MRIELDEFLIIIFGVVSCCGISFLLLLCIEKLIIKYFLGYNGCFLCFRIISCFLYNVDFCSIFLKGVSGLWCLF